jgi:hypothetical protein
MVVEGGWEEMERKELDCVTKSSCVIWSYSETVINPLPGYDYGGLSTLVRAKR